MNEIWKSIPGHEKYEASNLGRIRSSWNKRGNGVVVLKANPNAKGYLCVALRGKTSRVHQLVMLAFHGLRGDLVVNHKNGIKADNRLENLEYVTQSENLKHAYKLGLKKRDYPRGDKSYLAKLSDSDVRWIRKNYKRGVLGYVRLGNLFGVTKWAIRNIIKETAWRHTK